jgi:hypothetical protein
MQTSIIYLNASCILAHNLNESYFLIYVQVLVSATSEYSMPSSIPQQGQAHQALAQQHLHPSQTSTQSPSRKDAPGPALGFEVEHTTALGLEEERAAAPAGVKERVALGFKVKKTSAPVIDLSTPVTTSFVLSWSGGTETLKAK